MTTKSPEQVLADFQAEFGPKDGQIIAHLTWKVSDLADQWRMFLYLFCGLQERLDALNEASSKTTHRLQHLLWDSALLTVRRLTDREKFRGDENLSIEHLARIAKDRGVDLSNALRETKVACQGSRAYAAKFLAHLDLDHAMGSAEAAVTRVQTTKAIKEIVRFVRLFHQKVRETDIRLVPVPLGGDERQFLLRVHQGNQAEVAG